MTCDDKDMLTSSIYFLLLLQAEVFDVQYGTVEDLLRIQGITNVSNRIALLKLGHLPLLYKVGYGFEVIYTSESSVLPVC